MAHLTEYILDTYIKTMQFYRMSRYKNKKTKNVWFTLINLLTLMRFNTNSKCIKRIQNK